MPRLGPDILHRPLALPDFVSLGAAVRWLAEGAISVLPLSLRNKGWRLESALYVFSRDGSVTADGAIERSWTGATRRNNTSNTADSLPATIFFDPELAFVTQTSLPLAARNTLHKTIALRMDELSPIPPEDAVFAVGSLTSKDNRLHVDVAITRKSTINAAKAAMSGQPISLIGALPDERGACKFVFSTMKEAPQNWRKLFFASAALWVSLLLALGAFASRQQRVLAALSEHQTELRQELRELKIASEEASLLRQFAPVTFTLSEAGERASSILGSLPDGAVASELSVIGDRITVTGLTPSDESTPQGDFSRQSSDYPGFDRFTVSTPLQNAKVAEAIHD